MITSDGAVGRAQRVDALGDDLAARRCRGRCRSRRGSRGCGSSIAICSTSLRFFSPPEKPTLTLRFSMSSAMPSRFAFARTSLQELHGVQLRLAAMRGAWALSAVRRKLALPTPGDLDRVLEGQEHARRAPAPPAPSPAGPGRRSVTLPAGDLVALAAGQHVGQRALAGAVRPHDRVHLARLTARTIPFRISLPSTATCRSLISSIRVPLAQLADGLSSMQVEADP